MWPFKHFRPEDCAPGTPGRAAPPMPGAWHPGLGPVNTGLSRGTPRTQKPERVHPDVENAQLRATLNAARRREEIAEAEHQVRMAVLRWRREHPDIVAAWAAGEKK